MQSEIKDVVGKCTTCNKYAVKQQRETTLHELPTHPWQIVSLNPLQHSSKGFILSINRYSDFWEIDIHSSLLGQVTKKHCKSQPNWVISDQPVFPAFFCGLGF